MICSSTNDPGLVTRDIVFLSSRARTVSELEDISSMASGEKMATHDGNSVFAHVLEPDKLEGARPVAVDALSLVCTDDTVLQRGSPTKQEDRIRIATLSVSSASTGAAVVFLPAAVKGCSLQ